MPLGESEVAFSTQLSTWHLGNSQEMSGEKMTEKEARGGRERRERRKKREGKVQEETEEVRLRWGG